MNRNLLNRACKRMSHALPLRGGSWNAKNIQSFWITICIGSTSARTYRASKCSLS